MSKHVGLMDQAGNILPQIYKDQAEQHKGENARLAAFIGAIAVADLVKTTLGPKGMDKILQPQGKGKIHVTNDGATILKNVSVDNPAAKILIDISKIQDEQVGDGTTTVAVLAGELLREAEKLISVQKLHPQVIISGYRMAVAKARETLIQIASDNSTNESSFDTDLLNIAMTTLSSKLVTHEKLHFAQIAVDAIKRLQGKNSLELIQIIKKPGGQLKESFLAEGFILEKQISPGCAKRVENPTVLVANTTMDTDKVKIYGTKCAVDSFDKVAEIQEAEKHKQKIKVDKIINHKPAVFINRQLIYNFQENLLADAGICVIEHADFDGIERLAAVLDADIVSTFDNPERTKLGKCQLVEEILIGEDKAVRFSGCPGGRASSIVLRGSSKHVLDEAERSLHDALCVVNETVQSKRVIWGGGNSEIQMAEKVDELAKSTPGKCQIAIEAFARALRTIPATIADNAGLDSAELISRLRAELNSNPLAPLGIDVENGSVGSMLELKVMESFRVKEHALLSAHEAAEQILRVDEILRNEPRKRSKPQHC